ncbi:MAG: glycoside hydrolase family 2 TIM barrel-domain containing protein, partial [Nitrospinota bacterium]
MAILKDTVSMKILSIACLVIFFCFITTASIAEGANRVTTYRDSDGWKLKVDGKDFYVKGVVWGYVPKNENYSYSLWGKPDYYIKKVLDYEFGLMKKVGVNAFRSFSDIPPKWVTYIYEKYGIMTAINPLMGRYGALVGGSWRKNTDYSDSLTRKTLKDEVLKIVRKYKDVPGVLMFALGNESNYGLSWKSFEIEDLPVGEQNKKKARYLYSLFGEVITQGKKIDPNHPFTIVNGDIQYLDLIAEYGQDWDLLGVNAYRGVSFTNLWRDVKTKLDIPVLFFEFGADAFNAKDFAEDQVSQAYYLKSQWKEMYQKSSGHGEEGNSIGGFVFEWRDEWWKYKQTENLGRHDETASWANGGYKSDYVEGQNNMNEEWWGITSLGEINQDGVSTSKPRMAYDVLGEIWRINPYEGSVDSINRVIDNINMDVHQMRSEIRFLKDSKKRSDTFNIAGGRFEFDMLNKSLESDLERDGADGAEYDYGFMGFLDFEFKPTRNIKGDFTLNFIADASDSDFEFKYGDRVIDEEGGKAEKFELYSFQTSYEGNDFDLLGFYHVPRYHWGYKGDFFGLLRETTDMDGENGQDIWNAKAPYGVELIGKNFLDGLTIVTGPEVYWGANPKIITKYQFGKSNSYTFIHSEDFVRRSDSASGAEATGRRSRQTTIQGEFEFNSSTKLQIGGIISGTPKIGEKYDRIEDSDIILDEIKFEDTLGLKGKLSFSLFNITNNYLAFNYAGLVADGGEPLKEFGTQLPYSELGNKKEVEAGMLAQIKSFTIFPRVL